MRRKGQGVKKEKKMCDQSNRNSRGMSSKNYCLKIIFLFFQFKRKEIKMSSHFIIL